MNLLLRLTRVMPTPRLILTALFIGSVTLFIGQTSYAMVDGWNAGRIIDDGIFTDERTLDASQIQEFLNSKVPVCDTWGEQPSEFGGGTRLQWAQANGYSAPFTCLKDYQENGKSAAQIIYDISQQYTINPEVLIVLLQKEQGLVTDTWPVSTQYQTATGYGCPDGSTCDTQYYGLTNQLKWSATMFRAIMDASSTWYTPYTLGDNYIQYNPSASCGGSIVTIQNRSTQALYNYTPYQPNQAALDGGWNGGDDCSAYGNRNFYLYFTSWFGSTFTPALRWDPVSQNSFTDPSKTQEIDIYNLRGGERVYNSITVKNVGTTTWKKGVVLLGTSQPQDRPSIFKDWTWPSTQNNRAGTFNEDTVAPGQTATFDFWAVVPTTIGQFDEYFDLVTSSGIWMNDMGLNFKFRIRPTTYTWAEISKNIYTDAQKDVQAKFNDLQPNTRYFVSLKVLNTGNMTWSKNSVQLGTYLPANRPSIFKDWTWPSTQNNRAGTFNEDTVAPGQTGTIDFWILTPNQPGRFPESFNLIVDNSRWMVEIGQTFPFTIYLPHYGYKPIAQEFYTDSTKQVELSPINIPANSRFYASVTVKNSGSYSWPKNVILLGTSQPQDRPSIFKDWTWPSTQNNRAGTFNEDTVAPGQTATFDFWMLAPSTPGQYTEYFNVVAEYITWLNDMKIRLDLTVQ